MRTFLNIFFLLVIAFQGYAQEKILLYSHYTFNGLTVNPAYAGSHEMLSINLSHRSQWIGFEGAPAYNTLGIHAPFKNTKMGLGLLVMNESIGLRKFTGIYMNYAHRMPIGNGKLALGLKGGIGTGNMDPLDLGDEITGSESKVRFLLPNFGIGAYYYTKRFYAGFSIPLLMGYKTGSSGDIVAYHDFSNYAYYLASGIKLQVAPEWQVEPSALIQYDKAGGVIADGGFGVIYKDVLRVGASYRSKLAVAMLVDLKITYQLRAGIAYDYGISEINNYNRNSFEVALEYNFGYKIKASNPTIF